MNDIKLHGVDVDGIEKEILKGKKLFCTFIPKTILLVALKKRAILEIT